ncbi:MAG: glycosyltransferase [Aquihabitans sp.]
MTRTRSAEIRRSLATRRARPTPPGDRRLTVVIPAFREADRIAASVERVRRDLADSIEGHDLEIVVVDDGSDDGTADAARASTADQVLELPTNRGKGAAVAAGVAVANGRTIAFTDADLAYAPVQILRLLDAVESGWDVVVGSRHHHQTTTVVAARRLRDAGGRVINAATRLVLVGGHDDTQCGLKAFRSDVATVLFDHIITDGFAFDIELFFLAERYGLSLTEVPVDVENSDSSTVRVARDAVRLLVDLVRIRRGARRGVYDLVPGELDRLSAAGE